MSKKNKNKDNIRQLKMTNVYHLMDHSHHLLVMCACAHIMTVPRLKQLFLSEKNGLFVALCNAANIGGWRLLWSSYNNGDLHCIHQVTRCFFA